MPGACEFPLLTGEGGASGSEGHCARGWVPSLAFSVPFGQSKRPHLLGLPSLGNLLSWSGHP